MDKYRISKQGSINIDKWQQDTPYVLYIHGIWVTFEPQKKDILER